MTQTKEGAKMVVAQKFGLTVDELDKKYASGQHYCNVCKIWVDKSKFGVDKSRHDGMAKKCNDCRTKIAKSKYVPKPTPARHGPVPIPVPTPVRVPIEKEESPKPKLGSILPAPCISCVDQEVSWKIIPTWPNYEVSTDGRIRRKDNRFYLRLMSDRAGYLYFFPGRGKKQWVHRAVLEAHDGPCPDGHETRHLDGNRQHNCFCNLKWGTRQENIDDMVIHGGFTRGVKLRSKLSQGDILSIRLLAGKYSNCQIAIAYGVDSTTIGRAMKEGRDVGNGE